MGETLEISRRTVKNTTRPGQHVGKHGSFRHGINFLLNFVRKTPFELLTRRFHKAEWILWTPFIKKKRDFSRLRLDFYAILWNRARFGGGASLRSHIHLAGEGLCWHGSLRFHAKSYTLESASYFGGSLSPPPPTSEPRTALSQPFSHLKARRYRINEQLTLDRLSDSNCPKARGRNRRQIWTTSCHTN